MIMARPISKMSDTWILSTREVSTNNSNAANQEAIPAIHKGFEPESRKFSPARVVMMIIRRIRIPAVFRRMGSSVALISVPGSMLELLPIVLETSRKL